MPAGRALKPPGPASVEINTAISFALCVAPLAPPPPAAGAFYPSVQLVQWCGHESGGDVEACDHGLYHTGGSECEVFGGARELHA